MGRLWKTHGSLLLPFCTTTQMMEYEKAMENKWFFAQRHECDIHNLLALRLID